MYFKLSKFFLYIVPLAVVIVSISTLFPFIVGKYVFFRTAIDLSLIFFVLGLLFSNEAGVYELRILKIIKSPLFIAVSVFVLAFALAGFFGSNPNFSFWSNFERGEGGLQMLHLYFFFLLSTILFKEKKDWNVLFAISVAAALLVVLYGVGAGLKYVDAEMTTVNVGGVEQQQFSGQGGILFQTFKNFMGPSFSDSGYRFFGSLGNSSYAAAYFIFAAFYSLYLWINRKNLKSLVSWLLVSLTAVFLVFFVLSATRGAFVGLFAGIGAALVYAAFSFKKWRKYVFVSLAVLALGFISGIYAYKNSDSFKKIPAARIFNLSFSAETFQHRSIMWGIAYDGFKDRPLLGWGPENYTDVFDRHYDVNYYTPGQPYGAWFDRAHSFIFDYLSETGILGLLSYLSIFIVFYWLFFKSATSNKQQVTRNMNIKNSALVTDYQLLITNFLVFLIPIAYLVQGLALFEILPIYINLFLFLAFANWKFTDK